MKNKNTETADPVAVIICAAGSSRRMGGIKKEFLKVANEGALTVLGSAVRAFTVVPSVKIIVITVPEGGEAAARDALPPEYFSTSVPKILFVTGGLSRRASVYNALTCLTEYNIRYALIHDGARPWVSSSLVKNIIEAVKKYEAVIPLLPLTDTPKECDLPLYDTGENTGSPGVFINRHLKRANTGIAQTPQGFKFPEILYAHEKAALELELDDKYEEFTDDAEVWSRFYGQVAVIPGEPENRKITYKGDIG